MLAINLFLALLIALPVWYAGSRGLAEFIFRTETRNPRISANSAWSAVEAASNVVVFAGSVALWFGLTYLFMQFNR
jgi:hypothetical protein